MRNPCNPKRGMPIVVVSANKPDPQLVAEALAPLLRKWLVREAAARELRQSHSRLDDDGAPPLAPWA